jgi:hypothetical protein
MTLEHPPIWRQDGNRWHMLVGNRSVVTLIPDVTPNGVLAYVVNIDRDFWHAGELAEAWHAGEFYSLHYAQAFMRRWWIVEGSRVEIQQRSDQPK